MAIAQSLSLVIDCPDADTLGRFYAALLGWEVVAAADTQDSWVEARGGGQSLCFQQVDDFRRPEWPGQEHPQQMHLDVVVEDLDEAEVAVLELGATKHEHQPGTTFRVFLDPAGHPFCLCTS